MASEFRPPTPEEIAAGIFQSGRTPEQFMGMLEITQQGIEQGNIRTDLSCWEHKERFFEMAQRMYVRNDGMRFQDVEGGIHEGKCESPLCVRMQQAYFELLKPSQDEDAPQVAEALAELERELMIGAEIEDLTGISSGFYDPDTGETLPVAKAVDITGKCRLAEVDQAMLVYFKPLKGTMVDIREGRSTGGGSSVVFGLNSDIFTPTDPVFSRQAGWMKIDSQFLHAIINANAPQLPQPEAKQ